MSSPLVLYHFHWLDFSIRWWLWIKIKVIMAIVSTIFAYRSMIQMRGMSLICAFWNKRCRDILAVDIIYVTSLKAFLLCWAYIFRCIHTWLLLMLDLVAQSLKRYWSETFVFSIHDPARGLFFQIKKRKVKISWYFLMIKLWLGYIRMLSLFSEPRNYVDMLKCGDVDPLKYLRSEFAKATR